MDKLTIAKILLQKDCLRVRPKSPFTYASGLKGPMYCDNRKILAHVEERSQIIDAFIKLIKKLNLEFDSLCGLATAGIPFAALIAERLNKPFIYVRSKPKAHGQRNQVEGYYRPNEKTLLIEDLVNQGKSLEEAVVGIREAGLNAIACLSIVDYKMINAKKRLEELSLSLYSLTDFQNIIESAESLKLIQSDEKATIIAWQQSPEFWS
ncbi:MAG: orotate phosphoribosyltransferase [Bacteriovoracaceae bacterium]|jgi:orotate phosphoribosyltransferase|nr:orotate phosphoribosyltransferase [Bacteriovoracaceae bacterium]